jgi:hypothetical protein
MEDPLNSDVASDGGASGLAGRANLDMLTTLMTGLLKGAAIPGAPRSADASGAFPLGSASPLSSVSGGLIGLGNAGTSCAGGPSRLSPKDNCPLTYGVPPASSGNGRQFRKTADSAGQLRSRRLQQPGWQPG